MEEWYPSTRDLKRYPHFDKFLPPTEIEAIVKTPERVRTNAFYPFIHYIKSWQPFCSEGATHKKKERPIRYASRRDACIFSYPGKDIDFLVEKFDVEAFVKRFGRVEDFDNSPDYRNWTFWTYARRAAKLFGQNGRPIQRQIRRHRRVISEKLRRNWQKHWLVE